jgi:hypothetical protein
MADWSRAFDDPIPLPRGRHLVTLQDAAGYIMKLPKAEQDLEQWQTAVACLIGTAEGRDFAKTSIGDGGSWRGIDDGRAQPISGKAG